MYKRSPRAPSSAALDSSLLLPPWRASELTLAQYDMSLDSLTSVLSGYYEAFRLPIWLTEYALQNFTGNEHGLDADVQATQAQVDTFMTQSTAWMDAAAQSWVERYFWFGAMNDMVGGGERCRKERTMGCRAD